MRSDDPEAIARAMAALDAGGIVAIPGDVDDVLAVDALDDDAVERLLEALVRGADEGLLVMIGGPEDLHHVAHVTPDARSLGEARWPGPVAMVLRARPWLADPITGGTERVRVSVPRADFTRALAKAFGPLAVARATPSYAGARLRVDGGPRPGGRVEDLPVASL